MMDSLNQDLVTGGAIAVAALFGVLGAVVTLRVDRHRERAIDREVEDRVRAYRERPLGSRMTLDKG